MTTRDEAQADAAQALSIAYGLRDSLPLDDAVDAALHAGGPTREEVRAQIIQRRHGKAAS